MVWIGGRKSTEKENRESHKTKEDLISLLHQNDKVRKLFLILIFIVLACYPHLHLVATKVVSISCGCYPFHQCL